MKKTKGGLFDLLLSAENKITRKQTIAALYNSGDTPYLSMSPTSELLPA